MSAKRISRLLKRNSRKKNIVSQTAISVRIDAAGQRRYTGVFSNLGTPTKLRAAYSGLTLSDELQWDIAVFAAENLVDPL